MSDIHGIIYRLENISLELNNQKIEWYYLKNFVKKGICKKLSFQNSKVVYPENYMVPIEDIIELFGDADYFYL